MLFRKRLQLNLNKRKRAFYLSIIFFLVGQLFSQTKHWRFIWDKNTESDMDHYEIFRTRHVSADTLFTTIDHIPLQGNETTMTFTDTNLVQGVQYYYRIKAVNSGGQKSDFSDEVSAAIPKVNFPSEMYIKAGEFKTINFYNYVIDPDNADNTLTCSVKGYTNIQIDSSTTNQNGIIKLTAPDSFNDDELLTFTVNDPDSFFDVAQMIVHPLPSGSEDVVLTGITVHLSAVCSSASISWVTNVETRDIIKYGENTNYTDQKSADIQWGTTHQALLEDLKQGTNYHFQITSTDRNNLSFSTADSVFETCVLSGNINVYPIPYRAGHPEDGDGIHFTNLPEGSNLIIFNVLGDPVFSKNGLKGQYLWNVKNNNQKSLHTGVYLYVIKKGDKKLISDKLIIIR